MRLGTLEGLVRETTTRVDNLTARSAWSAACARARAHLIFQYPFTRAYFVTRRLAAVREETVEYERRSAVARSNISSLEKQAERLGMLEYKLRDRAAQVSSNSVMSSS